MHIRSFLLSLLLLAGPGFGLSAEDWVRNRAVYMEEIDRLLEEIRSSPFRTNRPPARFFDRRGILLAEIPDPVRPVYATAESIPAHLSDAVVQSEDKNFFYHAGIDLRGLARAAIRNILRGRISEGGSTLTQQLAKILFTTGERTLSRKSFDIRAALEIEEHYTKEEILLLYLNKVYLGHGAIGVEEASRFYFGKTAAMITPAEAALLAGLLTRPNAISPYQNPSLARAKQKSVLEKMNAAGYAFDAEALLEEFWSLYGARYDTAYASLRPLEKNGDPFWTDLLEAEIREILPDLAQGPFTVVASLDSILQGLIRKETEIYMREKGASTNGLETAVVLLENRTGEVRAMISGRSYGLNNQFNRAVRMRRQTGSLLKPFLYAAAFEEGLMDSLSIVTDAPLSLRVQRKLWKPENYDRKFLGTMTVAEALRQSRNIPAVRTIMALGTPEFCGFLGRTWGEDIARGMEENPSLALGTLELSPLQTARGYVLLATEGEQVYRPVSPFLRSVLDADGRIILDSLADRIRWSVWEDPMRSFSAEAGRQVMEILQTVTEEGGTAYEAAREAGFRNDGSVACKTGTTANFRDAWTVLSDRDYTLVVWMGYDRKEDPLPASGGRLAAPLAFKLWKLLKNSSP